MIMLDLPDVAACRASLDVALAAMTRREAPYRHWLMANVFPDPVPEAVRALPFAAAGRWATCRAGASCHNATRTYFDAEHCAR